MFWRIELKSLLAPAALATGLCLVDATVVQAHELKTWNIYFDPVAELSSDGKMVLAAVAEYRHYGCPDQDLILVAYTDSRGPATDNLRRSTQYALAVADELTARGVPAEKITVRAVGESQLAVATGDDVDEPLNRRVEVWFNDGLDTGACPNP